MTTPRIQRTAIHEAGHAVCGLALGLNVTGATIEPSGERLGCCIADLSDGSTRMAVWAASGAVAEHFYLESLGERAELPGCAGDWANIEKEISKLLPEVAGSIDRNEFFQHSAVAAVIEDAGNLCKKHWDKIEDVALYLHKKRTLHRDDLQALFRNGKLDTPREPTRLAARKRPPSPFTGYGSAIMGKPIGHGFPGDLLAKHGFPKFRTLEEMQDILDESDRLLGKASQTTTRAPRVSAARQRQLEAQRAAGKRASLEADRRLGITR